jgi:multisubunit Na+/H+ antiporter MnhE subunit
VGRDRRGTANQVTRRRHPSAGVEPHSNMAWPKSIRRSLRHPILFALSLILAPALWIVFVGSSNLDELIVGAVAILATIVFITFVCRSSNGELTLRPRDLIQLWRLPRYIAVDIYVVTLVAVRDLLHLQPAQSLYRVCGFDTSVHDPVRQARSVMAIAYTTASPNTIVIGIDPTQSRMLFHQIKSSNVPEMTKSLGAKQ